MKEPQIDANEREGLSGGLVAHDWLAIRIVTGALTVKGDLVQGLTALLAVFEPGQKVADRIGEELRGAEDRVERRGIA
jgi:hypothetical protein